MQFLFQMLDRVRLTRGVTDGLKVSPGTTAASQITASAGAGMVGPLATDAPSFVDSKGLNQKCSYVESAGVTDLAFGAAFTTAVAAPHPDAPAGTRGRPVFVWLKSDGTVVYGATTVLVVNGDITTVAPNANRVLNIPSTANLLVGANVTGVGIPALTIIKSIDSPNSITLSANATAITPGLAITMTTATVDSDGVPVAPETGPDLYSGVYLVSDLQKSSLRKLIAPSVLLAEIYKEQVSPATYDTAGNVLAAAVASVVKIDNSVKRYVLLTGKYSI